MKKLLILAFLLLGCFSMASYAAKPKAKHVVYIGLDGILAYKRSVKIHGQIVEAPAVIDKVGNDAEEVVPSQVPLSTKRTRTRTKVTRGMMREWYLASKKGMTHREIATMYGVSLVTVDCHLAGKNGKKAAKVKKASISPTLLMIDREVEI